MLDAFRGAGHRPCLLLSALLLVSLLAQPVGAEEPATAIVERVPFGEALEVEGTFVPVETFELKIDVEAYGGPLEIIEVIAEGPVSEGDVLVRFDATELGLAIEKSEYDINLGNLAFGVRERAVGRLAREIELTRTEVQRRFERARDDLAYFLEVDKPMRLEENELKIEGVRNRLADQKEELAQLEKMYGEDDLTEETEEIVLSRARRNLKRSEKSLTFRELRHARWLAVDLPREEENKRLAFDKSKLEHEKTLADLAERMEKAGNELSKARLELEGKRKKFQKLKGDLERLVLRAPISGQAFAGAFGGSWKGRSEALARLAKAQRVKDGTTLWTVVPAGGLVVKTSVEEQRIFEIERGLAAAVSPTANPSLTLRAIVESVAPVGSGKHEVRLRLLDVEERLTPGMTCKGAILLGSAERALCVPASAIVAADGKTWVLVVGDGGSVLPVAIVPGQAKAGRVSVDSVGGGLKEGQHVLLSPPQPEGADTKEEGGEKEGA